VGILDIEYTGNISNELLPIPL